MSTLKSTLGQALLKPPVSKVRTFSSVVDPAVNGITSTLQIRLVKFVLLGPAKRCVPVIGVMKSRDTMTSHDSVVMSRDSVVMSRVSVVMSRVLH